VPELPRLDNLVGPTPHPRHDANGVFDSDARYFRRRQKHEKPDCLLLLDPLFGEPPRTGYGQVGAWRVGNHEIPLLVQDVENVPLIVISWLLRRE
jgi:hypothetical protein